MWAVACTAFFGFIHLGELLPESATVDQSSPVILWSDVAVACRESPAMIRINLRDVPSVTSLGKGLTLFLGEQVTPYVQ